MKTMATRWIVGLLLAALPVLAQVAVIPPGSGTTADPYRLAELGHLVWLSANVGASAGMYYVLTDDIDAAATASWDDADTDASVLEGFIPIGTEAVPFAGDFDGQGHVIRGLTINRAGTDGVGLFGWTRGGGALRHLGLEGGSVTGRSYVGGLLGHNNSGSTIEQCYATGTVTGSNVVGGLVGDSYSGVLRECYATGTVTGGGHYVGGLAGLSYDTIEQCYATGAVTGAGNYVGGLVGLNHSPVVHCYATGAVSGTWYVGGLLGDNYFDGLMVGIVTECYATGAVTGESCVGGLAGYNCDTVEQCHATGDVTGGDYVGGLVGYNYDGSTIEQCYATGTVMRGRNYVGGLAGYNCSGSTLTACYATGAVQGNDHVGGLVGTNYGTLTTCHATGAVAGGEYVGGLLGLSEYGTVEQCYATGTATGENGVGGLLGRNFRGTVRQCYATGTATGESGVGGLLGDSTGGTVSQCHATGTATGESGVGGLLGYSTGGTVRQCYATGTATGEDGVGGLLGYNTSGGTVEQCYATGAVVGISFAGGVAGWNGGTVGQCYWDTERSGWSTSDGGTGCTTAQMQQQSTYADWDFTTSWGVVAGLSYPYLQWFPPPFTLALVASGPGSVSADPAQASYPAGALVTLHAVADANAEFVRWSGPVASPTAAQTTVTVTGHLSVVGLFRVVRGISSVQELQKIGNDPAYPPNGRYWLTRDVDAAGTAAWNDADTDASVLEGFSPIGTAAVPFTGDFDGQGYVIRDLTVNRPGTDDVGLFGKIGRGGVVRRLGLEGGSVTGDYRVGGLVGHNYIGTVTGCHAAVAVSGYVYVSGLVGRNDYGTVEQSHATGAAAGEEYIGGLVGLNYYGTLEQCYATGVVTGMDNVGGLVGYNAYGPIKRSYATGAVTGDDEVGGLLGYNQHGTVEQCYATGAVAGADYVGGLVGESSGGTIKQSYATGAVSGHGDVGGLVGRNYNGPVEQSYATGEVNGDNGVGGLVGSNDGTVEQCYATGEVNGTDYVGGLVGRSYGGTVEQSYWDTERSGWTTSVGGEGKTTAEMRQQGTYAGWDFASLWGFAADLNGGSAYLRRVGPWLIQLLAVTDAAAVAQGRGLWDLTGTYPTSVAGYPLTLHLGHDSTGRLTGSAVLEGVAAGRKVPTSVNLTARGAVRTVAGTLLAKLTLQGTDSARTVRAALALDLTLDVGLRQLRGPARGTLRTTAGTTPVTDDVALALPAAMDGTWTLLLDLARQGRADSGTALLTLSNGAEQLFAAVGRSSGQAFVLSLSGAATDPAAKGIGIRATAIPSGGGWARLEAFATLDFGQRLGWR